MREKILKRQVKQTTEVRHYVRRSRIEQVISSVRRGVKTRSWGQEQSLLFLKEGTVGGAGERGESAGRKPATRARPSAATRALGPGASRVLPPYHAVAGRASFTRRGTLDLPQP